MPNWYKNDLVLGRVEDLNRVFESCRSLYCEYGMKLDTSCANCSEKLEVTRSYV